VRKGAVEKVWRGINRQFLFTAVRHVHNHRYALDANVLQR
jgi:hypothetical protein